MRKFLSILTVLLLISGAAPSAYAMMYGAGYSELDLASLEVGFKNSEGENVTYGVANYGFYQASGAFARTGYETDGDFYVGMMNSWAAAFTDQAFAASGVYQGDLFAVAAAYADDPGVDAIAKAGTFAAAYGFYAGADGTLDISIDYYLAVATGGDGLGYSEAGAGAMIGLLAYGVEPEGAGDWLSLAGEYGFDDVNGTLSFKVDGLRAGNFYTLLMGNAAYAYASAAVPEPATMMLLGLGLLGLAGLGGRGLIKRK